MILENIHCLLQFDDRGNLLALVSKSSGRNYIVKDGCSLFRLTMTEIIENRVMPGTLALTGDMAEQIDFIQQSQCLEIDYRNLDGMPVTVKCTIGFMDEEIHWNILIENKTRFAVSEIEYPVLLFKPYLGLNAESERILLPKMDGILLGNPELHPWEDTNAEIVAERYWYPGEGKQKPNNLAVQMTAYYDEKEGILIYAADTDGYPKKMGPIYYKNKFIDLSPVHLRPEIPKMDFSLEYTIVTRFFKGDWKQAAQIYKKFAETAPWCNKTISEREDIPDWIKKGAFFLSFRLRYQNKGEAYLDYVPDYIEKWKKILDIPIVAMMCGWEKIGEWAGPDYFPPFGGERRFRNMCGRLMRNGEIPFTFGLSGLKILIRRHRTKSKDQPQLALDYDGREIFEQQYRESAALDINGVPIVDSNIDEWDGVHAYACPATEQAKSQIYGASIRMLKEYGVIMQQADQVLGGGTSECYNFGHGHPPGRGIWQIESLKKIYDETRKDAKKISKDFALSQEWISEPFIQYLDIYHCRNYDKPQGGLESIPLFSYLYHKYIPCYAGDWTSLLPDNKTGVYFHGWNFICGNLPAGSPLNMLGEIKNHEPEEADPKIMEMACNVCAALKNATSYLIYGEMLPTEELPVPGMDIYIQGLDFGFKRKSITVPSVLSMFWKNPAGKIACALANVSDETKIVDIPVDSYMKHIQKVFVEINGYEKRYWWNIVKGKVRLKMSARSAAVVREER